MCHIMQLFLKFDVGCFDCVSSRVERLKDFLKDLLSLSRPLLFIYDIILGSILIFKHSFRLLLDADRESNRSLPKNTPILKDIVVMRQ